MSFNLFIGNHGRYDGIEDFIAIVRDVLGRRGVPLLVSTELLPGTVNLVIDEFTNYRENRRLREFKARHPETPLVLILTEFLETKYGVESFNLFDGIEAAATVAVLNPRIRAIRDDLGPMSAREKLATFLFAPLLAARLAVPMARFALSRLRGRRMPSPLTELQRRSHRLIYLHARYLGMRAHLHLFDGVMSSHESVIGGYLRFAAKQGRTLQNFGILYPEFDAGEVLENLMVGKGLFIEMTGSVTPYRQGWIERLNYLIAALGMRSVFDPCQVFSFSDGRKDHEGRRGAYSLHPPQTQGWPYSSPMRIYRALATDHNLPILVKTFGQSPIEDVCYMMQDARGVVELYEMYHDRDRLARFVRPRLARYAELAGSRNDALVGSLVQLGRSAGIVPPAPKSIAAKALRRQGSNSIKREVAKSSNW